MSTHIEPGSIIAAVDGSAEAHRAVLWAAEQAYLERRRLAVVSVARADHVEAASITADAVAAARKFRPGLSVDGRAVPGEPRQVLLDLSSAAHLVVMGSRGRGTVRSMLLGSVSAAVSKDAACPVVVCRPGTEGAIKHGVLVGADGTPGSRPVIEFAFQQASLRGLPLTVLHSSWDLLAATNGAQVLPDSEVEPQLRLLLSESVAGFSEKFPEVHVSLIHTRGFADECLSADSKRWNLVVVGRHPLHPVTRYVARSVSTSVLERSRTTVAVVPQPARS